MLSNDRVTLNVICESRDELDEMENQFNQIYTNIEHQLQLRSTRLSKSMKSKNSIDSRTQLLNFSLNNLIFTSENEFNSYFDSNSNLIGGLNQFKLIRPRKLESQLSQSIPHSNESILSTQHLNQPEKIKVNFNFVLNQVPNQKYTTKLIEQCQQLDLVDDYEIKTIKRINLDDNLKLSDKIQFEFHSDLLSGIQLTSNEFNDDKLIDQWINEIEFDKEFHKRYSYPFDFQVFNGLIDSRYLSVNENSSYDQLYLDLITHIFINYFDFKFDNDSFPVSNYYDLIDWIEQLPNEFGSLLSELIKLGNQLKIKCPLEIELIKLILQQSEQLMKNNIDDQDNNRIVIKELGSGNEIKMKLRKNSILISRILEMMIDKTLNEYLPNNFGIQSNSFSNVHRLIQLLLQHQVENIKVNFILDWNEIQLTTYQTVDQSNSFIWFLNGKSELKNDINNLKEHHQHQHQLKLIRNTLAIEMRNRIQSSQSTQSNVDSQQYYQSIVIHLKSFDSSQSHFNLSNVVLENELLNPQKYEIKFDFRENRIELSKNQINSDSIKILSLTFEEMENRIRKFKSKSNQTQIEMNWKTISLITFLIIIVIIIIVVIVVVIVIHSKQSNKLKQDN